jgi:hypothetical protein
MTSRAALNLYALRVMNRVMEHPVTHPLHPYIGGPSGTPGLNVIRRRVKDQYYRGTYPWMTAVETAIHAFESASGDSEHQMAIAAETRRLFARERARGRIPTVATWTRAVAVLDNRLKEMMAGAPWKPKPRNDMNDLPFALIRIPPHTLAAALNATELLAESPATVSDLVALVEAKQEEGLTPDGQVLNFAALKPETIERLCGFIGSGGEVLSRMPKG